MTTLLIQSCSQTKRDVERRVPALDLYSGYFFKIIKKAKREGRLRDDLDICILSAKHGLLNPQDKIGYYDREMDTNRAAELNDDVVDDLLDKMRDGNYEHVVLNVGDTYRVALAGLESEVSADFREVEGNGIGYKGRQLKRLIRTDEPPLEVSL